MKAATATRSRRGFGGWLPGVACGALVTLATPTALLLGVLLVPSGLLFVLDRAEGKPTARAVLLFGLATAIAPVLALWSGGHTLANSLSLLSDPVTPAAAWAAQGAGWLLMELLPLGVRAVSEMQTAATLHRLRTERAALEQAWGIPPAPTDVSAADPAGVDASAG